MKKRWTSEKQILDEIDKCHSQGKSKLAQAEQLESKKADTYKTASEFFERAAKIEDKLKREAFSSAAEVHSERAAALELKAEGLRKQATRLIEVKAKKLGNKLSEFRTGQLPMPGIPEAEGVQR